MTTEDRSGLKAAAMGIMDEIEIAMEAVNRKRGFGWEARPWVWVVGFEREA